VVWLVIQLVGSLELLSHRGTSAFQKCVDRILILPIHIRLGKHLKIGDETITRPDMFYDSVYLAGISTRFLSEKLVAREAQYFKGPVRVLLCKCIERIVLRGVASEGGQVDN